MSDDELDAELLGMVGDDSDEEGQMSSSDASPRRSPEPVKERAPEPTDEDNSNRKGVAQKVRARGRNKRKTTSDDDDDFGAGSPSASPPQSLGSEAMAQSDSDVDAPADSDNEDGPLYPIEGKYLSSRDREDILSMPEIRREEILAERAAEVVKRQQDIQLRKTLATAKAIGNKQKRKAETADLDDGGRRSTRPKAEKARSALDDYRRARELKGTERGRLDSNRNRRGDRSQSPNSDRDADGDSEVEWAEPSSNRRKDDPPADLRDFERCRIGRSNFAKVCFYPDFETAIKGCFCRVSIGLNRETGQNLYRMAQIKGFTEGKPYQMEGANGKHFTTDQYAIVAQGSSEKPWPFSACSDGRFTDGEYQRYIQLLGKETQRVPTRKFLLLKLAEIHNLLNTDWTDQRISIKLNKQKAMERKHDPANAPNLRRQAITQRRTKAEEIGDTDEMMKCDAELAALENMSISTPSNGARPKAPVSRPSGIQEQQERLAKINMKNRGKNAEEVRRALIEEKRKLHMAREQAIAEGRAKEAARLAEEERKKTVAVASSGENGVSTPSRSHAGTPKPGSQRDKNGGLGTMKKKMDDEIIGGMDLGIDLEI